MGGGVIDGFVDVVQIEFRELEMLQLQEAGPDQPDQADGGLAAGTSTRREC